MGTWNNDDGLHIRFGTDEAVHAKGGEYRTNGAQRQIEFDLNLVDVADTASAPLVLSQTQRLPQYAFVEKIEVVVLAIADGASAAFDMGLAKASDLTELNYDGLLDGLTEAALDDTEGATYTFVAGSSSVAGGASGVLVGDLNGVSEAALFTVNAVSNDNDFTAGRLLIRVHYSMPTGTPS